jgi:hypothetical protein
MVCFNLGEFVAGRDAFVITVAPLPMEGGTDSPVNPVAIFSQATPGRVRVAHRNSLHADRILSLGLP